MTKAKTIKINETKIIKEITDLEKHLARDGGRYHLTTKGIIHLTLIYVEQQLK